MLLHLTRAEGEFLHTIMSAVLEEAPDNKMAKVIMGKIDKNSGNSNKFETTHIIGRRVRGRDFPPGGEHIQGTALNKFGWVLTHKVTGETEELRPVGSSGVTRKVALQYARFWSKLLKESNRVNKR